MRAECRHIAMSGAFGLGPAIKVIKHWTWQAASCERSQIENAMAIGKSRRALQVRSSCERTAWRGDHAGLVTPQQQTPGGGIPGRAPVDLVAHRDGQRCL
jgi:hypothetical protein